MRACVLLIEGTNCEEDAEKAFKQVGVDAERVHLKQLTKDCVKERHRNLMDYDILFIPGGWSAGDYVRAGAIFAARLKSKLGGQLSDFVDDRQKYVFGVCNGFQVLVESGLLPGFDGISEHPEAILTINASGRFQCRPTYIRHENKTHLTEYIPEGKVLQIPVAHAEGRFTFGEKDAELLKKLEENRQIAFRYCDAQAGDANQVFPLNPNGSLSDIAGICNPEKNVLGMMPHPERVIHPIQQVDWTRKDYDVGDGLCFFESIRKSLSKKD